MNGLGWYVIHSHPRKESFVGSQIEQLGREVFVPKVLGRGHGRRQDHEGPLFPCYLFARLSARDGDIPRVRWTHGVRQILGEGGRPRPVHDALVATLRTRTDERGRVRLGVGLSPGQRVQVNSGPLAGLVGKLNRCASKPQERVRVLLEIFRRAVVVELDAESIRGVSSGS